MVENTYGIAHISIDSEAKCFCPLGQDWYTNHFEVDFYPNKYIPDYCEMDKWIAENINGKHLIIEDAVCRLHDYMMQTYQPEDCTVISRVDDAKHSKVVVIKFQTVVMRNPT